MNTGTENMAKKYYQYYYDEGMFGNDKLNRIFTSTYFESMLHDMYTKLQNYQDRAYSDKKISTLKASMFFGDWVTSQTILKVMGEEYEYFPSYTN